MTEFIFRSSPVEITLLIFFVQIAAIELPYRLGLHDTRLRSADGDAWNTLQAGLLTLVSFVLGLTYAQSQARFDARRELVVQEANSIGTTWLRADQLDPAAALRFRTVLTRYTADRLQAYATPNDPALYERTLADSEKQQSELWNFASRALRATPADLGRSLLLGSVNDTIDLSAAQLSALTHHVPTPVVVSTFLLVTLGTLTIGLRFARAKSRPITLSVIYALALTFVFNLIIDYDRPQIGFVRVSLDPLSIQLQSMQK